MTAARRARLAPVVLCAAGDVVVVDKPSGMLCGFSGQDGPGVLSLLDTPDAATLRPVTRLDPQTSGATLYARSAEAERALTGQLRDGTAWVVYHALVSGHSEDTGEIELLVGHDKRTGLTRVDPRHGKPACTRYVTLQRVAGASLLECRTQPERPNPLRAHLSAVGLPLLVDPPYGGGTGVLLSMFKPGYRPSRRRDERPLLERLSLHAARVELDSPADGRRVELDAPMPKDLRAVLAQLGRLV